MLPDSVKNRRPASPPPPPPPPAAKVAPPQGTGSGVVDAARGTVDGVDIRRGIEGLNGAGDSTFLRLTPEVKVQGNVRVFKLGGKAQLGSTIQVTRDSDDPNSTYTVRYDKQSLAAATGEIGTDTVAKARAAQAGQKATKAPFGVTGKAELGGQGFDAVEMRFASKDEAIRAAQTLQGLQRADMIDDAMDLATLTNPALLPASGLDETLSGGGGNPAANPLNDDGTPGRMSQSAAGVDSADMDFLRDHISAYETTIGSRGRLALEVKGDLKLIEGGLEGRLDETRRISRRVELPTDTQDGSVTYSVTGGVNLTAKERANRKIDQHFGGLVTLKTDNRLALANATVTASLHYRLPAGTDPSRSAIGGRPVPEADSMSGNTPMQLDKVSIRNQLEYRDQALTDPSRGDSKQITETLEMNDPARFGDAARRLLGGDYEGAARAADARLVVEGRAIHRDGIEIQPGGKLDIKVGDVEASLIVAAGTNDVTARRSITVQPGDPAIPETVEQQIPPAPEDDGKTYAVQPFAGVSMRNVPDGERNAVIQSGSFLRDEGGRRTDAGGMEWMEVSGTDQYDAPARGWVRADLLAQHSSATGAMDETGRINPTAEYNRMDRITVEKDDNLWNLAQEHGWDYQETLAANRDHLENPSLIFKGDTVYVPGSARGPKPIEVVTEPAVPATESVTKESSGTSAQNGAGSMPESASAPGAGSASDPSRSAPPVVPFVPQGPGGSASAPAGPSVPPAPPAPQPTPVSTSAPARPAAPSRPVQPTAPDPTPAGPATTAPANRDQAELDRILRDYQVLEDEIVEYTPNIGPLPIDIPFVGSTKMTATEADLLDQLGSNHGLMGLREFRAIASNNPNDPGLAYRTADAVFPQADAAGVPIPGGDDGHNDAFRHAYWNALMTDRFGENFATGYGQAHEGVPGNPAKREAMDLYNNEVGRRIATQNPGASDEELAGLVHDAVLRGDMIVIDGSGNMAWSDQVEIGKTGLASGPAVPGRMEPHDYDSNG